MIEVGVRMGTRRRVTQRIENPRKTAVWIAAIVTLSPLILAMAAALLLWFLVVPGVDPKMERKTK